MASGAELNKTKGGIGTSGPSPYFAPGQGAIYTPDPTLGGDWTHTRADVPLFRNAPLQPSAATPATGSGTGTRPGEVRPPVTPRTPYTEPGKTPRPTPTPPAPRVEDHTPRTAGTTGMSMTGVSGQPPNYSYYGVPYGGAAASSSASGAALPGQSTNPAQRPQWLTDWLSKGHGLGHLNPLFQQWKQTMQNWQGGQSSNPAFQNWRQTANDWRERIARALEQD